MTAKPNPRDARIEVPKPRAVEIVGSDVLARLENVQSRDGSFLPGDQGHLRGRRVAVPGNFSVPAIAALSIPREEEERVWTIMIQQVTSSRGSLKVTLNYGIGEAIFSRVIGTGLQCLIPIRFKVVARYIEVYLNAFQSQDVLIAACPGDYTGPEFYSWIFTQTAQAVAGNAFDQYTPGNVVLGQVHFILKTAAAPGTPLWPMVFDAVSTGLPGPAAIPKVRMGAVFNAGDDRSYADEEVPGDLQFVTGGVVIGLSTTPETYTAAPAGNLFVTELKIGY